MMSENYRLFRWLSVRTTRGRSLLLLALTVLGCQAAPKPPPSSEVAGLQTQRVELNAPAASTPALAATPSAAGTQSPAPPPSLPMIGIKPLLNLQLEIMHCPYDVYVNGGLVERNAEEQPASGTQPINHWLCSGENEVAVHMNKWRRIRTSVT